MLSVAQLSSRGCIYFNNCWRRERGEKKDGQNERDKDEREVGELRAERQTETEALQTNMNTNTVRCRLTTLCNCTLKFADFILIRVK